MSMLLNLVRDLAPHRGWRIVLPALCAALLLGCGGGGGGGSSPGAGGFNVTLDRSSIEFTFPEGVRPPPARITATATGTIPNTLYVGAVVEGQGIDPEIPALFETPRAVFNLQPRPGLPAGTYQGRVLLSACSDAACATPIGGTPLPVNYRVVVLAPFTGPAALSLAAAENGSAPVQQVPLAPPSGTPADVATGVVYAGTARDWLLITRTPGGIAVAASAVGLGAGTYNATLVLTPPAPSLALQVPVTLTVGPGLVQAPAASLTAGAETRAADLVGSTVVRLADGPALDWTASSSAPWLQLTAASGNTGRGDALAWRVDTAALAGLANFADHVATVTVNTAAAGMTPMRFDVTLQRRLPEVQALGPALVIAGQATRLTLRGRGFGSVADLAARLPLTGLNAASLRRASDREITVDIAPGAVQAGTLAVSNALGLPTASATLHVVAPQTLAYAALPSPGNKRALVWDARRSAAYAVNTGTGALSRFRLVGSTWAVDETPLAGVIDAGLTLDGERLMAVTSGGQLQLLDPATMTLDLALEQPGGFARHFTHIAWGIPTTLDGRSWLVGGSLGASTLLQFDGFTRTLSPWAAPPELNTSFVGGPWAMVSRDGTRMLMVQTGGISPAPPTLVLDSDDGQLRPNTAGLTFFYDAHHSDDASRVLLDSSEVRDRALGLVGRVTPLAQPGGAVAVAGLMSPDGTRAYVLTYPGEALTAQPTLLKPRVNVFDTRSAAEQLPLLGSFELPDFAGCRDGSGTGDCAIQPRAAIAPDGRTLFYAGSERLLVVPVPPEFRGTGMATGAASPAGGPARRALPRTQVWPAGAVR